MGLFIDSQFYSIDVYDYSYANITLFFYYSIFLVRLEISKCLSTLFFCKVVFVILDLLNFHMHFRNNLFFSAHKPAGALIGTALNL